MPDRLRLGGPGSTLTAFAIIVIVAAAGLLAPASASAQTPAVADTVISIDVTGNLTVDVDLVRRGFGMPVGSRYSTDAVRRGIRRLYDLGFFTDISVEAEPAEGGLAIMLRVVENPRVGGVEYSGLDHFKKSRISEITGPLVGRLADDRLLAQTERRLRKAYERDGYTRARIQPRYLPGDSEARRILFLEIVEGAKMRVEAIRFVGASRVDAGKLRGAMSQGTTGFLRKGIFKPEVIEDDKRAIEARMANLGFRDGRVLNHEVLPGSKDDRLVLQVTIVEGPLYYVGSVRWEGNEVMPAPVLYAITELESGKVFSRKAVEKTQEKAYEVYAERGYIYVGIRPDYTAADSVVDVSFRVLEGEPSRVRDIIITGNTRTKEKVIRRQLAIRPGDLFRRNALVRSTRELQQLGYFSNLIPNSRPVPDSNDIDLIFEVEERQVGTASAGFGFSSSVGLTGFMELGHSNLFGNGQSLNLRMERGGRRNNAEISFTEPWFLGTPTSLGVDLFSTNRIFRGETLNLEIRRAGGAIRVGRPLPLAYTRAFATYRLETQSVVDETVDFDTTGVGSEFFITGFRLDQEDAISSSFTLQINRNSTDHPIYPTIGSVASIKSEFSGGPFGGDQVFQKYEFDHKRYLATINAGGWRPTLMIRNRIGAVGDGFRDSAKPFTPGRFKIEEDIPLGAVADTVDFAYGGKLAIPTPRHFIEYVPETTELFRLGGTTFNPLRGYEDFEIVPVENVNRRFEVTQTTTVAVDTTGASPDTTTTTAYRVGERPVFYPGGRYMWAFSTEWQFPVADPLHGLLFFDMGGTWNDVADFRWDSLRRSVGFGIRMEVPLLGLIGFDYGYGFDRLDQATGRYTNRGWEPHIQFGRIF